MYSKVILFHSMGINLFLNSMQFHCKIFTTFIYYIGRKSSQAYRPSHLITVMESIHEVDSENMTALHSACVFGNYPVLKELLRMRSRVDVLTSKGQSPIHLAVFSGSYECVKELIKYNAAVNVSTTFEKNTPLHIACDKGFGRIAELLLQNGADVKALNIMQRTPLHCAAVVGRVDLGE